MVFIHSFVEGIVFDVDGNSAEKGVLIQADKFVKWIKHFRRKKVIQLVCSYIFRTGLHYAFS